MSTTVSDSVIATLGDLGVQRIYGIPGDAINALVESIRKQERVQFVQVRHEETGAFAAAAEAKLTGALGVCCGTAGPGAVHLLNGLYDAKMDHAPVLAITGQTERRHLGTLYHQEIDLYTLFKDVSVFNQVVVSAEQMPGLIARACQAALAHRGVAHLSIPADVADQTATGPIGHSTVTAHSAETEPCDAELREATELLDRAKRVVILAGAGCRGAEAPLLALAERLGAPIIKALRGKDLFPDEHPHAIGGLGLLGTRPAVDAIADADAILLAGTDFPYRDFLPDDTPAVQIDIDPSRLGLRIPVEVALLGHAAPTLAALVARVRAKEGRAFLEEHQKGMRAWFERMDKAERSDDTPIRPQRVARRIGELAADDAVFACDTGAVTVWGARNLRLRGTQRFTLSSSLASMAYAMPAAIGAQLAYPGRQVIALAGDGGLSMLLGDFLTAVKYALPLTVVVFNNGKLGLIQMEQEVSGHPEFQTHLQDLDYGAFARLCGGDGWRVESPGELDDALQAALSSPTPSIVDVRVNPEERTMPPEIELKQAVGYGVAKVRELLGQGDRGDPSL